MPSNLTPLSSEPSGAGTFRVLYVDPPWPERGGGQIKRGADRHYPLMTVRRIVGLPIGTWAGPDAHCYCWVTNNYIESGLEALRAWGFRYVTMVTWVKHQMGLGQYYRGMTEQCLFGVRGHLPYRMSADGKRAQGKTVIYEPPYFLPEAFAAPRGHHSVKPVQMREFIEHVSEGPYLECFARETAPGWTAWGNEVPCEP